MRLALLLLAACGRIGFDPGSSGPGGDDGGGGFDGPSACPARDVGVGREHACMIDFAGGVWCWGNNSVGQAIPPLTAKGTTTGPVFVEQATAHIIEPQQVTLPGPATKIAAGRDFTCALLEDGSVRCWGGSGFGQLGDNNTSVAGPSQPALGGVADDIAAGTRVACARLAADHSLACWGDSRDGELGVVNPSPVPVAIPNTAGTTQISLGHRHNCAVLDSGAVRCWGKGLEGQTGGSTSGPNPITVSIGAAANVSVATTTSCGVEAGGAIKCWGSPGNGRLGDGGASGQTSIPVSVSLPATGVEVALGVFGGCARMADKTVSCWGRDLKGDGTFAIGLEPKASALVDASRIVAGHYGKCAIEGGRVACWGPNQHGQLGRGTRSIATTPTEVNVGAPVLEVRAGFDHACARTTLDVRCWGANFRGEVGDGTDVAYHASPVVVNTGLSTVSGLVVSGTLSCAFGGGQLSCWGEPAGSTPALAPFSGTAIDAVAVGSKHLCAVVDNATTCAGKNDDGQLGDNSTTSSELPVAVQNLPVGAPSAIVAGSAHTCALVGGTVFCWGAGGRVGDGTNLQRRSATQITIPGTVTQIAAGFDSTLAVTTTGEVYCWGDNSEGECGLGNTNPQLSPVPVTLAAQGTEVSLTAKTGCVRLVGGTVTCFGLGGFGQLGNGGSQGTLDPVLVSNLTGSQQISAGHQSACAIGPGGGVFCWGSKSVLADGDNSLALPVVVVPSTTPCP